MTLPIIACAALTVAMLGIGIASWRERLPRNFIAGIKTTRLLRDDVSWRTGHKAAAPIFVGLGLLGLVAIAILAAVGPGGGIVDIIMMSYIAIVLVGLAGAAWTAGRAVQRLDDHA